MFLEFIAFDVYPGNGIELILSLINLSIQPLAGVSTYVYQQLEAAIQDLTLPHGNRLTLPIS